MVVGRACAQCWGLLLMRVARRSDVMRRRVTKEEIDPQKGIAPWPLIIAFPVNGVSSAIDDSDSVELWS